MCSLVPGYTVSITMTCVVIMGTNILCLSHDIFQIYIKK